jgi:hypothetical protein
MTPSQQNVLSGVALAVVVFTLACFFASLAGSRSGEIVGALGSVVGGILGALGAALAVYLTLRGQREDETEKICTAIVAEIAQLSRFPYEQLAMCRAIAQGSFPFAIPIRDLPTFMQTPSPTLYLSAAEQISRVHRPTLVIAFYIGLAETDKCVSVIVKTPTGQIFLTPHHVSGLGTLLVNQCYLARQILADAPVPRGREGELVRAMLSEFIQRLDLEIKLSQSVFRSNEDYERATAFPTAPRDIGFTT